MARFSTWLSLWIFLTLPLLAYGATAPSPPLREILVKAAASDSFRKNPEWEKDILDRIVFVNKIIEPAFNIHLKVIQHIPWDLQDETRETSLLMEELRSFISLEPNQIIMGFHKMSQPFNSNKVIDIDTVGSAQFFLGFIVIRDPFGDLPGFRRDVVLAHEVGHLFGAIHIPDENAIMHASVPLKPSLMFDEDNQQMIQANREVDFTRGLESLPPSAVDGMIQIYEKKIRENPHSDFYYQLGKFYQYRKENARAVQIWEEALRYHYDNPNIHHELGFYYYQNSRYALAIQELGSAIAHLILPSQKKALANTLNFLGVAYYQQGNLDLAIFNWLKGLSADPDNLILQGNLALGYLENHDADRAVVELEKLSAKNLNDATTLSNLGAAYLKTRQLEKAVDALSQALKVRKPDVSVSRQQVDQNGAVLMGEIPEAMIRINLGAALSDLRRYDEALVQLEQARALNPKAIEAHQNLIQVYNQLKRYDDAIKEIQEVLRYKQDDPYMYAALGQAYSGQGKMVEAVQAAKEGLRYTHRDGLAANFHKNIGITYLNQKRFSEALEEFNAALAIQWKDSDTHMYLGIIFSQTGKMEQAERSLKTALQIDSKNAQAAKILESIKTQNA